MRFMEKGFNLTLSLTDKIKLLFRRCLDAVGIPSHFRYREKVESERSRSCAKAKKERSTVIRKLICRAWS